MRMSLMILVLLAICAVSFAQTTMPRMVSVDPMNGKIGDVITVTGENLQKSNVAKVYLTDGRPDGKNDLVVEVVEQNETTIKFKIPAKATGRLALMVLTTGKDAQLIEQPVKVTIDAPGTN